MTESILSTPSRELFDTEVQRLEGRIDSELETIVSSDDPRLNVYLTATTEDEIKNQILLASSQGGGTVVIEGRSASGAKTYVIDDISVPSGVRLVSRGKALLQCPQDSDRRMLSVPSGAVSVRVEGLTFDHGPGYHGTVYYDDLTRADYDGTATIVSQGTWVHVVDCEVRDSALDGMNFTTGTSFSGAYYCRVYGTDRNGIAGAGNLDSPTEWFTVSHCDCRDTFATGVTGNGPLLYGRFLYNDIRNTGGSGGGASAYSPHNVSLKIIGNTTMDTGNNGTHASGSDLLIWGNSYYRPQEYGIFAQSDLQVRQTGCTIGANYIERPGQVNGRYGMHVGYYDEVEIEGSNRIVNSGSGGLQISNSDNVSVGAVKIRGASGPGIRSIASRYVTMVGPQISGHTEDGVLMEAAADGSRMPIDMKVSLARITGGTYGVRSLEGNRVHVVHNSIAGNSQAKVSLASTNNYEAGNI